MVKKVILFFIIVTIPVLVSCSFLFEDDSQKDTINNNRGSSLSIQKWNKIASQINESSNYKNIYIDDNYLYAACGYSGLKIYNIIDPANPKLISKIFTGGDCQDVVVNGNYAYIADNIVGLIIVNTENKETPIISGRKKIPGAYKVCVYYNYAYILNSKGISKVNISNPINCNIERTIETIGYAEDIFIPELSSRIYIIDSEDGLLTYDSELNFLKSIKTIGTPNGLFIKHYKQGENICKYAYIATSFGLEIIDIKNDINKQLKVISANYASDVIVPLPNNKHSVSKMYAYLANKSKGLTIIDVTDPYEAKIVKNIDTPYTAFGVCGINGYTYIADGWGGLHVFKIFPNIEDSLLIKTIATNGNVRKVAIQGNNAFMPSPYTGLQILNISDINNISISSQINTIDIVGASPFDVFVKNDFAYLAAGQAGLIIINISDIRNPQIIKVIDTISARGVFVQNNTAYIADSTGGLKVIDVTSPNNAYIEDQISLQGSAEQIYINNGYAYISVHSIGIKVVDIKTKPVKVIKTVYAVSSGGISVNNNYLYFADSINGLRIIDIKDPQNAKIIKTIPMNLANSVFVSNNTAFVSDSSAGIKLIDIVDPSNAYVFDHIETENSCYNVNVVNNVLFCADYNAGLVVFEYK